MHVNVPAYGEPTWPDDGSPATFTLMSAKGAGEITTKMDATLFSVFGSFVAPVLPMTVEVAAVAGVPDTVQVTVCPTGTVEPWIQAAATGLIVHPVNATPAGSPATEHVALVAAAVAPESLVQL